MILTTEELSNFKAINKRLLVELPEGVGADNFKHSSGLIISTTLSDKYQYHPVTGVVVSPSKNTIAGDEVFYNYLAYESAKDNGASLFECNGKQYMLLPEKELIFIRRKGEIIAMNGLVILRKIKSENVERVTLKSPFKYTSDITQNVSISAGGILIPELGFEPNMAEVVAATPEMNYKKGDIVSVVKDFDVQIENELKETLGESLYYLDQECAVKVEKNEDKWVPVL